MVNSGEYKDVRVASETENANFQISDADKLIAAMNSIDTTPNLNQLETTRELLRARNQGLKVGYQIDKLNKLNSEIQATKVQEPGDDKLFQNYNFAASKVDNYVSYKQGVNNLDEITEIATTFEHQRDLAKVLGQLLEAYKTYNNDTDKTVALYISNVVNDNELSTSDTIEQIDLKIQNAKNALIIARVKKEFSDAYNELYKVLGADSNWKIFQGLNKKISALQEKKNNILYDDTLTVPAIKSEEALLLSDVRDAIAEKTKILNDFNKLIEKTDARVTEIEKAIENVKKTNTDQQFTTFEDTKTHYQTDKEENRREEVGFEEVENYYNELEVSYYKDLAKYDLSKLKTTVDASDFGDDTEHQNLKTWTKNFISNLTTDVNDAKSRGELEILIQKIKDEKELLSLQKIVADYIKELNANPKLSDEQRTTLANLKQALDQSEPKAENNYSDLKILFKRLNDIYVKEVDIQKLRQLILDKIGDPKKGSKDATGIRKAIQDELDKQVGGYDEQAATIVNDVLDKYKEASISENNRDNLVKTNDKLNELNSTVTKIAALANQVAKANKIAADNNDSQAFIIRETIKKLNSSVKIARSKYAKATEAEYTRLIDDLSKEVEKAQNIILLSSVLESIKTELEKVNYFSLNGVDGSSQKDKQFDYIGSFEREALKVESTAEVVNRLKERAEHLMKLVELQKQFSDKTEEWVQLSVNWNYLDQKNLINLIWEATISQTQNSSLQDLLSDTWISDLDNLITVLKNKYKDALTINEARSNNQQKLQEIKDNDYNQDQNQLKIRLNKLLAALTQENTDLNTIALAQELEAKLNKLANQIDKLKELAESTNKLSTLTEQVYNNDSQSEIYQAKELSQALVDESLAMFSKVNETSDIEAQIAKVNHQFVRLDILFAFEKFITKFTNDKTLLTEDKTQINRLIQNFKNDYKAGELSVDQLYRKYFGDIAEQNQNRSRRSANPKDNYIETVFLNSQKLRNRIDSAKTYVAIQNSYLDDNVVTTTFTELKELINQAVSVLQAPVNDEDAKTQMISSLESKIDTLLTQKRNQLANQKAFAENLKTYIQNITSDLKQQNANDLYLENFQKVAIDDLQEADSKKDELSYSQVNNYLNEAKNVVKIQIFKIYNLSLSQIREIEMIVQDFVLDFTPNATSARSGANIDDNLYTKLTDFKNTIDQVKTVNYTNIDDYQNKINNIIHILNSNSNGILNQFITQIKTEFANKMDDASATPGFYKHLTDLLEPLKNNLDDKNVNLYQFISEEQLLDQANAIKNEYENLLSRYNSEVKDATTSSALASFAISLNDLNNKFFDFQSTVRSKLLAITSENPLVQIFADLYKSIRYNINSEYTNEIKTQYETFANAYIAEIQELIESMTPEFKFSIFNKESQLPQKITDVLKKAVDFKNWIHQQEKINMLFKQIDETTNISNPLPANPGAPASSFSKKYEVIIAKDEVTRKKFVDVFNQLNAQNQSDTFDITNADALLDNFKQFAFTKKDVANSSQKESIFSSGTFKVKIKKYSVSDWFDLTAQQQDDVDRKSLKMKLVYSYESQNSILGKVEFEREVTVAFKTLDTIRIQSGNSSIFYGGMNPSSTSEADKYNVGLRSKVLLFNVEEAGWNTTNVADIKNAMIQKAYDKFKDAVFNGNNDVDTDGNRKTLLINKDTNSNYFKFLFNTQESLALTYNISLYTPLDKQLNRIFVDDSKKEIAFVQYLSGKPIGLPTYGDDHGTEFGPETYDSRWRVTFNAIPLTNWWNSTLDDIKPALSVNLYKFAFDYDVATKNLYIYNTWVENVIYLHSAPEKMKVAFTDFNNDQKIPAKYKEFSKEVVAKINKNPNYVASIDELQKLFAYYSMKDDNSKVFKADGSDWGGRLALALGSSGTYGNAFPIWPLNGGQATVNYPSNDPTQTRLVPMATATDFADTTKWKDGIIKNSARQALYSTSIGEFWFKIRK
ncbi:hypothetical protein [Mycoplasma buteonis]|uniref:hypothetical protein n=1 Tax=Mycoplasma buteonis TaxID=171280 RepID=UPI0005665132|nr:hypothetical protein [Mycoplasma buteonis]